MEEVVYGPYTRKDGRQHVIVLSKENGIEVSRRTVSYPKHLVEQQLQRKLMTDETIDHFDRDHQNHSDENLIIRKRAMHTALDTKRVYFKQVKCPMCKIEFTPSHAQMAARKVAKAGPFCTRSCAGKYGQSVQMTGKTIERSVTEKVHYHLDKSNPRSLFNENFKERARLVFNS